MYVRFEMSGGYGGLFATEPLTVELESDDLPDEQRPRFEKIARAALTAASESAAESDNAADLMSYKLHIVDGNDAYDYDLDDLTAPPETWPLIEYMRDLAVRRRTGKRLAGC